MPTPRQLLVASRHADSVADNDSYWPNGFVAELQVMLAAGSDEEHRSPKLVEMSRRAAEELTADAIAQPRRARSEEASQQAAFEARLEARWGHGLDLADLVAHEAYESGRWVNDLLGPAAETRQDRKFEALIRLHGKAVMTAREVLVLLRSGYSSGALARWRTLHEVWVVFLLLADGDQELSLRYLVHEVVESLKGQEEYEQTWETLGHEPPDWTAAEREETREELVDEFGRTFLQPYGWAAPMFNDKAPNAGLVDPAQCSLIGLAGLTASLMAYAVSELPDSADHGIANQSIALVRHQSILLLVIHAIETFAEVHAQQEAEEEATAVLVSRATAILQESAPITAEDLSTEIEVDLEALAVALGAAAARGELLQETHYHIEAAGSATGERDAGERPAGPSLPCKG